MTDIELNNVMNIFKKIEKTSGNNDKVLIIRQNKDNGLFRYFLNFLYNETITTGLSDKKINKKVMMNLAIVRTFNDVVDVMDYISKNNTGKDKVILNVKGYLESLPKEEQEFLTQVFTKSYKCGITSSSINKAIQNLIPEFKVQLAHSYAKYADKMSGEFWCTTKLDGHRTLVEIHANGPIIFRTRKGHEITGMSALGEQIRASFKNDSQDKHADKILILDGEITVSDKSIPIEKVFQETSKIIRKDGEKKGLKYHIFDVLTYDEFIAGESKHTYKYRRNFLDSISKEYTFPSQYIEFVPVLYHGSDASVIPELMKKATSNGEEGLMLNYDTKYFCKRHSGLLKVKEFFSCDGIIHDVYEGKKGSKYEGMLGGLVVGYKTNEGIDTHVNIGSGFSDEERVGYWSNPDRIVGLVGEYQYFDETNNSKNDRIDLRFATWKRIRYDKGVDDVNYE